MNPNVREFVPPWMKTQQDASQAPPVEGAAAAPVVNDKAPAGAKAG